jgi:DNA-binding CsgD family transcriptional regulator
MVQNTAVILDMALATVNAHRRSIHTKFGVCSRSQLTLEAIRRGVIDCPCQEQALRRAA